MSYLQLLKTGHLSINTKLVTNCKVFHNFDTQISFGVYILIIFFKFIFFVVNNKTTINKIHII